jgi:hypothetical protein
MELLSLSDRWHTCRTTVSSFQCSHFLDACWLAFSKSSSASNLSLTCERTLWRKGKSSQKCNHLYFDNMPLSITSYAFSLGRSANAGLDTKSPLNFGCAPCVSNQLPDLDAWHQSNSAACHDHVFHDLLDVLSLR